MIPHTRRSAVLIAALLSACSSANPPPPTAAPPSRSRSSAAKPEPHPTIAHEPSATAPSIETLFPHFADRFAAADTDHDGYLSRAEAAAAAPMMVGDFDAIDTDHDGLLSREEIRAFLERRYTNRREPSGVVAPGSSGSGR